MKEKKKKNRKTLWKNVNSLRMSNFTFSRNLFYAIFILKSFLGQSQNGVLENGLKRYFFHSIAELLTYLKENVLQMTHYEHEKLFVLNDDFGLRMAA